MKIRKLYVLGNFLKNIEQILLILAINFIIFRVIFTFQVLNFLEGGFWAVWVVPPWWKN